MKLSKTARAILSVTALAWSIPFVQSSGERLEAEEARSARGYEEATGLAPDSRFGRVVRKDGSGGGSQR
jgi:uncharacterized small protein (DUF1192 family)